MEKTTSIMLSNNEIFSSIEKLSPQKGDVLIFSIATDEDGYPFVDLENIQMTVSYIKDSISKDIPILCFLDKFCLFSCEEAESTIRTLKNYISYIRKATGLTGNMQNEKFENGGKVEISSVDAIRGSE